MNTMTRRLLTALAVLACLLILIVIVAWPRDQFLASALPASGAADPALIARGAYLAKAGDCMSCHTTRGGAQYAGGRALPTPFGNLIAPNITSDAVNGIGAWSADDFWGALHNGKSRDGRLLYPAFPYPSYTKVTRADSDALYAFMRTVAPSPQARLPHTLAFPYNQQAMLAGWRLMYFTPGVFTPDTTRDVAWNRGAYLVDGLGHCVACHSARNAAGASAEGLSGGMIPVLNWYAPSLTSDAEAGLGSWELADIEALLKTGVSARASVFGPMAEVVQRSLQHLSDPDVAAMATYLKSLPATPDQAPEAITGARVDQLLAEGKKLYGTHCVDCHGVDGKGMAPAYPPLAGNRALTMPSSVNAVRVVLNGGFAPLRHAAVQPRARRRRSGRRGQLPARQLGQPRQSGDRARGQQIPQRTARLTGVAALPCRPSAVPTAY
jgi:mono/diheme cytochrome c family protein